MALLVQEDAGELSLIEDIQQGLLGLASHLSQSQSFCYRCHEAALDHVHNQHHLGSVAYFTWGRDAPLAILPVRRDSSLAPPSHTALPLPDSSYHLAASPSPERLQKTYLYSRHSKEGRNHNEEQFKTKSTTDPPE